MNAPAGNDCASAALRHWHPVLLSSKLRDRPVGVKILGSELVLFRGKDGKPGALNDRCPHRGARLSTGSVEDECVVCPYHLWSFDREGRGHSPVNPRMKPFTRAFDVTEMHGLVWVKLQDHAAELPEIDRAGLHFIGHYANTIDAPFPLIVDNFSEIEHSPTNHFMFAFDAEGIKEVEPKVKVFEDWIHIVYAGPQRPVPWWTLGSAVGMRAGTRSVIDFKVKFAPIHWTYDLFWEDPKTDRRLPQHIREFAFITPRDDRSTAVFLLFFTSLKLFSPLNPVGGLLRRIYIHRANHEFLLDKHICENVAGMDPRADLDGLQLGKFDHVLRNARKLINSTYYGAG